MVISGVNTVTYNGDGITTAWPYTFPVTDDSEIRVQLNNADGTAVIVESDYYVDLINSTVYYPGYAPGSEPPEAEQPPKVQEGQTITVYREIPITQESDLGEKWPFEVIEKGLDKLTMIAQQIDSGTKRTIDNALASMELLADVVVDSDELQHITDQLNSIDANAAAALDSENSAIASATAAANSATEATTAETALINFLETKETLTAPAVDTTLTVTGAAADAKVTGDAIKSTQAEMSLFGMDDLLWDSTTGRDNSPRTSAGVTYVADTTNKTVTVVGTSTGTSFYRFFYSLSTLPQGIQAGGTYIAHLDTDADVTLYCSYYVNNQAGGTLLFNQKGVFTFTIPSDATGCLLRLNVASGKTVNATVRPFISTVPSLKDIFRTHSFVRTSADLNTLTEKGSYFITANVGDIPHSSNPLGKNETAILLVYPNYTDRDGCTQIFYGLQSPKSYTRRLRTTGIWEDWMQFPNEVDFMKKLGNTNAIPSNTDFNDLTETGFAFINAGNYGYVNAPPLNGGVLRVFNTGAIVTQYANSHKTTENYTRRKFNDVWSDWVGVQNRKSLKYLAVGNSGSQDMLSYVPWIMKNVAPDLDITIGITYASGARIDQQIDYFDNDDPTLQLNLYRPNSSDKWVTYSGKTLKECLIYEDWDIISVQQASTYQMLWSYYSQIPDLIDRIATYVGTDHDNYVGHPVKIGYLAPQVRIASNTPDAEGKYRVIETPTTYTDYMDCVQRALDEYPLEFAIMSGTAVQTARKETTLDQYGNAEFNDGTSGHMNADYAHLQEGIGCMVASYASTLFLLDLAGIQKASIWGESTRPDLQWVIDKGIPGKNPGQDTSVVGISDENCLIAQKCAIMAHKKPFEVSTIH